MLQFDGLYVAVVDQGTEAPMRSYSYLRFYSGGVVLAVSSPNQPHEVAKWYSWKEVFARGTYTIRDNVIRFTTRYDPSWEMWPEEDMRSRIVIVDYAGTIDGETLRLKWHNSLLSREGTSAYSFVALDLAC